MATANLADPRAREDRAIYRAMRILDSRMRAATFQCTDPDAVSNWLRLRLAACEREEFVVLFLNNQHRLIEAETLFLGGIDSADINMRVVAQRALHHNAAAIICAHNHPSGSAKPSEADKAVTRRLKEALGLIDVRVLDHFVVGNGKPTSFAELGLMKN